MTHTRHSFCFHGAALEARLGRGLWWPAQATLIVADLHFGKAARPTRHGGGLLPPYEMRETLARLDAEIADTGARRVIALGDSFDDPGAEARMNDDDRLWLARLMAAREWIWVAGNHDPGPPEMGGSLRSQWRADGIVFRHEARIDPAGEPEVSAHFHPKFRLPGAPAQPCFLIGAHRIVLPAFGAYTGGLDCTRPPLCGLLGPGAHAVLCGKKLRLVPVPRSV